MEINISIIAIRTRLQKNKNFEGIGECKQIISFAPFKAIFLKLGNQAQLINPHNTIHASASDT